MVAMPPLRGGVLNDVRVQVSLLVKKYYIKVLIYNINWVNIRKFLTNINHKSDLVDHYMIWYKHILKVMIYEYNY